MDPNGPKWTKRDIALLEIVRSMSRGGLLAETIIVLVLLVK